MDQRERVSDFEETLRLAVQGIVTDFWAAAPATVNSFDPVTVTAEISVLQKLRVEQQDGSYLWLQMPPVHRCPVIFMQGGGFTIAAPPKPGTEVLAIFATRSIDEWWQLGGVNARTDLRQFSHCDAFVLAGCYSKPKAPSWVDANALEIRNDSGSIKIRLDATGITLVAPLVKVQGNLEVTGNVISDGNVLAGGSGGVSLETHLHSGVQSGGSNSGPPLP